MISQRTVVCIGALAISWLGPAVAGEESTTPGPGDCGTLALYHLFHLEGRPVDLDRIESTLGAPTPEGHSFRELRDVASDFGLKLDAVAIHRWPSAIQGPALVFVKGERQGHFLVVRPVGHTGRLIQVLDGGRPPVVTDAEWLFGSPSWTGLALVPHRPNYLVIAAICLAGACMVALRVSLWARKPGTFLLKLSAAAKSISASLMKQNHPSHGTFETPP